MNESIDYLQRLALVRTLAKMRTGRSEFTPEEVRQFSDAARMFTFTELKEMIAAARPESGPDSPLSAST